MERTTATKILILQGLLRAITPHSEEAVSRASPGTGQIRRDLRHDTMDHINIKTPNHKGRLFLKIDL